jgi:ribosomal-protein-alanine N-acetyltransferase
MSVPEVTRYSNWPEAPTYDQANEWTRNPAELFPSGKGCAWVIAERSSGAFIGAVRFNYFYWESRVGGIGYEAHPDYWGRGLTTEALRAVFTYGHRAFALNQIEAWTLPGNDASDRVLEKAGFRFEGIFRQKGLFQRGVSRLPHAWSRGRRCCDGCACRRRSPRHCRMSSKAGQMCRHLKTGRSTRDTLDA